MLVTLAYAPTYASMTLKTQNLSLDTVPRTPDLQPAVTSSVPPSSPPSPPPLLQKTYRALTSLPVPTGRIEHFMFDGPFGDDEDAWHASGGMSSSSAAGSPSDVLSGFARLLPRGPRLLSDHPHVGWKRCTLEVCDASGGRGLRSLCSFESSLSFDTLSC